VARSRSNASFYVAAQRALLCVLAGHAIGILTSLACADPQALAATALVSNGDIERGKVLSESERCQGCHGEEGDSVSPIIPRLSGQHAAYLFKQLQDFKSGARNNDIMSVMAADIADADLADIAAFYASAQAVPGEPIDSDDVARNIFANGDTSRNIVACAICHGSDGRGMSRNGITYPSIAGQHRKYLRAQMVRWSLGERSNSDGGVMNDVAKALSGREMEALSAYISGL
jgi:cytochrome c553